jgi:hypothetical protein
MAYIIVNLITMTLIFTLFISEMIKSKAVYFIWSFGIFFCEVAMVIIIVNMKLFNIFIFFLIENLFLLFLYISLSGLPKYLENEIFH